MASACVTNATVVSPARYSSYGCSTREIIRRSPAPSPSDSHPHHQDPVVDFEFCHEEDPATMLSADELFSDGKLVPLKFSGQKTEPQTTAEVAKPCRRLEMEMSDLFSPKAPRCTTRWRELLGLKRLANAKAHESAKASSTPNPKASSFKQLIHRGTKPSSSVKETDISETVTIATSRLSLSSSSSSGHEIDDIPRLSLDLDNKPSPNPFAPSRTHLRNHNQPRIRRRPSVDGSSSESRAVPVTADSPRLNASGKIVFHGLERSSSSPGSFTGGPRMKQSHGMPRSYSANVRITPVLNVPVSSLKSSLFFGQIFSSSSSSSSSSSPANNGKNRTNRTRAEPKCDK